MNALFELIGTSKFVTEQEVQTICDTPEYNVEFGKLIKWGPNKNKVKVDYHHKPTSQIALKWVKTIAFARIQFGSPFDENTNDIKLRSNRNIQDEFDFLEKLNYIDYDSGYGIQELFGIIVFKDGTWLEREEYDGSEWWKHCELPTEESLFSN